MNNRLPRVILQPIAMMSSLIAVLSLAAPAVAQIEFNVVDLLDPNLGFDKETLGDFNGDGLLDLATTERKTGSGALLLSDGIGGYSVAPLISPGATALVAGDFNHDDHLDLVLAEGTNISLRLGDGTGQLGAPTLFPAGSDPILFLEAVDLDQNGDLDLVLLNDDRNSFVDDEMIVLLGTGTGQFSSPVESSLADRPLALHVGSMNADSIPDVVTIHPQSRIVISTGDGAGGFVRRELLSQGPFELEVSAAGDLNNDGFLDLFAIAPNDEAGAARVHLGDGSGSFHPHFFVPLGFRARLDRPVLGDWDADGILDVALLPTPGFAHTIAVFYGVGDGSFEPDATSLGLLERCNHLVAADVDSDGDDDLLATLDDFGPTTLLRSNVDRSFDTVQPIQASLSLQNYTVADLNEDGHQDILANTTDEPLFLVGDGEGGFSSAPAPFAYESHPLFIEDFTGDGNLDVGLVRRVPNDQIRVFVGDGAGNYSAAEITSIGDTDGSEPVIEDFDRDGNLDFIVESVGASVTVYFGAGDGRFENPTLVFEGLQFDPRPGVAADLNDDDNPDLVVLRRQASNGPIDRMTILLGDGNGAFRIVQHLVVIADRVVAVDEDGDGHTDLVTGRVGRVEILRGNGTGQFETPVLLSPLTSSEQLEVVDLTGDGLRDLVGHSSGDFKIAINLGGGSYRSPREFSLGAPSDFGIGDFDEDGLSDMVWGRNELWPLLNRTRFYRCREGNVNAGAGSTTDVLFVNDSPGNGRDRKVRLFRNDPLNLRIDASPSGGSRFAIYVWATRLLQPSTALEFGFGVGTSCMPMPIHNPLPPLRPLVIWKTIPGFSDVLGKATHPSTEAPSLLFDVSPIGIAGEFIVQGVLLDSDSAQGQAALTNAVVVSVQNRDRP